MRTEELRETFAAIAHEAWAGWMDYLFGKCVANVVDGEPVTIIPNSLVERWVRQMSTPYSDLPEGEKESDRVEADKYLAAIRSLSDAKEKG